MPRSCYPGDLLRICAFALMAGPIATVLPTAPSPSATTRGWPSPAERLDTTTCDGHNQAICTLVARGSLLEALKAGRSALLRHPSDSQLLNNVGCIILFALREPSWSRAEDYFQRSLQNNAVNAAAMYNYAMLLSLRPHSHRHNKKCSARQLFRAACQLDPALPSAILAARAVLARSSSCMQMQEMDDVECSSTSSRSNNRHRVHDACESSSGFESSSEVVYGIHSREHTRNVISPGKSFDGKFLGQPHGRESRKSGRKVASKQRCSNIEENGGGAGRGRTEESSGVKRSASTEDTSYISSISQLGRSASLIFCATLSGNKVSLACDTALLFHRCGIQTSLWFLTTGCWQCLMASNRAGVVSWIQRHCSKALAIPGEADVTLRVASENDGASHQGLGLARGTPPLRLYLNLSRTLDLSFPETW